jgi:hypothetical protein
MVTCIIDGKRLLIRRPIPPSEAPRPTQVFQLEDYDEKRRTTANNNLQNTSRKEIVISLDLSSQHSPDNNHSKSSNRLLSSPTEEESKGIHRFFS